MSAFFRFPHTPHLAWLGEGQPRRDKVLSTREMQDFLDHEVTVEEKVDGANIGISLDEDANLRVQSRGSYVTPDHGHPQFKPLFHWISVHADALTEALFPDRMLFGEWCYAVHSVRYTRLPDWFLAFDVYDRGCARFFSVQRRDALVAELGLALVPHLARGRFDLSGVQRLLDRSRLGDEPAEGLYVRHDDGNWLAGRAKLVRPEFAQAIDEHWSRRPLETNQLDPAR